MFDPALLTAFLALAEKTVNGALSLDAATQARLRSMAGRSLAVCFREPALDVFVLFEDGQVSLRAVFDQPVDVSLSGTWMEFIRLGGADDKATTLINSPILVEGDSAFLTELQAVAGALEIDWEGLLARGLGDVSAHQLGRTVRRAVRWGRKAAKGFVEAVSEYAREESGSVVSRPEFDQWRAEVESTRAAVERIDLKLARVAEQLNALRR